MARRVQTSSSADLVPHLWEARNCSRGLVPTLLAGQLGAHIMQRGSLFLSLHEASQNSLKETFGALNIAKAVLMFPLDSHAIEV